MTYLSDFLVILGIVCICSGIYLLLGSAWCLVTIGIFALMLGLISTIMSISNAKKPVKPIV